MADCITNSGRSDHSFSLDKHEQRLNRVVSFTLSNPFLHCARLLRMSRGFLHSVVRYLEICTQTPGNLRKPSDVKKVPHLTDIRFQINRNRRDNFSTHLTPPDEGDVVGDRGEAVLEESRTPPPRKGRSSERDSESALVPARSRSVSSSRIQHFSGGDWVIFIKFVLTILTSTWHQFKSSNYF